MPKMMPALVAMIALTTSAAADDGLVNVISAHSVKVTADRLEQALLGKGMTVFARIDHAAGAANAGLSLPATELVIFGNPKVGTPLMLCQPSVAIDLPQKALIREDEQGKVWLSYNDPHYLVTRHNIRGCEEVVQRIANALDAFATAATEP